MAGNGFCERHGPFDAEDKVCPYCAMENGVVAKRPSLPRSGKELPTQIGVSSPGTGSRGPVIPPPANPINGGATKIEVDKPAPPVPPAPPPYVPPAPPRQNRDYPPPRPEPPVIRGQREPAGPLDGANWGGGQDISFKDDETLLEVPASSGPLAFLLIQSPLKNRGQVITLLPGSVIGRKNVDVVIPDRKVSRQHARINLEPSDEDGELKFAIHDFNTPNGTRVNGKKIVKSQVLEENDEIRLGEHTFVFKTLF